MTGKRPREMRRTMSISSSLSAGSSDSEISPKCESVDQKSACSVIVPRKVIGFNPRIFPEAAEIVPSFLAQRNCAALPSPRSPRPASGLESLFHSPRPDLDNKSVKDAGLMKKDPDASGVPKKVVSEDVGLGIVAALHSAADAFHACLMGGCRDGELCSASKINDPGIVETQNRAPNSKLTVSMQNQKNPAPDSSKNRLCFRTEGAASNLNRDLGKQSRVAQRSDPKQGFGHALIRQASAPNYVMQDESGLAKVDFLEICFLCKHRLRQGRDIYMYRGDKAFCSVECRHQQILNDERAERREKCSAAALEKGSTGPQTRHCEHRDRVISATSGTTAAAA